MKAPQELPPLREKPPLHRSVEEAQRPDPYAPDDDQELIAKRARSDARAQQSACWEDLISFLELNKLPGAYALAFSAYGIEDLSSLLLLDDTGLCKLLEQCNIDAMDEILLLEALRNSRPWK